MRKPEAITPPPGSVGQCPDGKFSSRFPLIAEFLSTTSYEDGSPRTPSTLSIRIEEGEVRLALNDVDNRRSMFTASTGLDDAMKHMDAHLKSTGGTWRPWKDAPKGKRG